MEIKSVHLTIAVILAIAILGQCQVPNATVPQKCLRCMCQAATECNFLTKCGNDVCGPFGITYMYWMDSGVQTRYNDCTTSWTCSVEAVQRYMTRYRRDCNGDGVINCDDFIRIHRHGPFGCMKELDPKWGTRYAACVR